MYLFLVALAYSMWLVVVAGQLWVDRATRRRREATERRVAAGAGPGGACSARAGPGGGTGGHPPGPSTRTLVGDRAAAPSVVVAALVLFNQFGDLPDLFGLGPTGTWVVAITLGVLAAGAAIAYWWLTMHGLDAVTLAHVTVAGAELPDIDSVTDAAAAATGLSTGILTVRVHAEWRLVNRALEPVPHPDERSLGAPPAGGEPGRGRGRRAAVCRRVGPGGG